MNYDVIIAGSGIAGSYLAYQLTKLSDNGLNVLLLEKNKKVILKDSGIVSKRFNSFFKGHSLIKSSIKKMALISPSDERIIIEKNEPFAYLLHREKFSRYLRKLNHDNIVYEQIDNVEFAEDHVTVKTDNNKYNSSLVVGADGVNSVVRQSLGIKAPRSYLGLLIKTKNKPITPSRGIEIFLNKYFSPEFFSWIIPQNKEYGLITNIRPSVYLEYFKKAMDLGDGDLYSALIPIGLSRSYGNRALLIGDACGQVKPITGGGIIMSLIAAEKAAHTIINAFDNKRFDSRFLRCYDKACRREFGRELHLQFLLRRAYRKLSNKDIDKIFRYFGEHINSFALSNDFDYDYFTAMRKHTPKWKIIKFASHYLPFLLGSYSI